MAAAAEKASNKINNFPHPVFLLERRDEKQCVAVRMTRYRSAAFVNSRTNFNLYHYAGNNPVKYTDPDGNQSIPVITDKDMWNIVSQFDPVAKLANLLNSASSGNETAQTMAGYVFHEAGRDILGNISDASGTASLAFLAVGYPEGAGTFGAISMVADGLLSIDDLVSGNKKEGAIGLLTVVAGYTASKGIGKLAGKLAGVQITVGKTGKFYEIGKRGAIKSESALRKLITRDIASGYFGKNIAPEAASQIVDKAIRAFRAVKKDE